VVSFINKIKNGFSDGAIKYFKNTIWLLLEKILRIFSGVVLGIWIARYLGPSEFGVFSFFLAVYLILGNISRLGLDPIVVKNLVNNPRLSKNFIASAFIMRLISGFIFILFPIAYFLISDDYDSIYLLVLSLGIILQSFDVIALDFEANVNARLISISKMIQILVSSIVKVILILTNADLIYFFIAILFDVAFLSLIYYITYCFNDKRICIHAADFKVSKRLISESWPLILTSMSIVFFNQIDKIMIGYLLDDESVGLYAAGSKFSEALVFLPAIISASLFPAILNAKKKSENLYFERLQLFYFFMTWSAIAIIIFIFIFSDFLIGLYGDDYIEAKIILIVHSFSLVFVFQWVARGRWIIAENLQSITFYYMLFGALFNVISNYYLINYYGITGAAVSTVLANFLITMVFPLFFKDVRGSTFMLLKSFVSWKVGRVLCH
jgi:O-antigen/teichoic acid export membrane protein